MSGKICILKNKFEKSVNVDMCVYKVCELGIPQIFRTTASVSFKILASSFYKTNFLKSYYMNVYHAISQP